MREVTDIEDSTCEDFSVEGYNPYHVPSTSLASDPEAVRVRDWRHKLQKAFLDGRGSPKPEICLSCVLPVLFDSGEQVIVCGHFLIIMLAEKRDDERPQGASRRMVSYRPQLEKRGRVRRNYRAIPLALKKTNQ